MAKVLRDYINEAATFFTAPTGNKAGGELETKASEAQKVAFRYINGIEHYPPRAYRALVGYSRTNPIVRRALKLCGEAVAGLEPIISVGGKEVLAEDAPPALQQVLRYLKKPNPNQDGGQMIAQLVGYYKASGNGWCEYVPGLQGYAEFYALRPDRMNITPGPNGWAQRYSFDPGNGAKKHWMIDIQRGQASVLHIKDPAALDDDLYGHGALEAADKALAVYDAAWVLARSMFENSAMPAGALVYSPKVPAGATYPRLSTEQREDLQKQLEQKFKGPKNKGKPMVMGEDLRWEPMGQSMVDMEAIALRESAARDIANAFGVPPILLNIPGDSTYSNFQEASRGFYRNTVFADARMLYGAIGRWWAALTGIRDLEISFDEEKAWALADEITQLWQRVESSQVLTFEEKRDAIGYDERPPEGHLLQSPMGGLASLDEMLAGDYGLFNSGGPRQATVVDDQPADTPNPPKLTAAPNA